VSGSKNLIMGFCAPRTFGALTPFIASLRHTAFTGDVLFLVEDVSEEIVQQLRAHGVIVARTAPSALPRMTATASRFFSFLHELLACDAPYGRVMLVDPASVVFQADPFAVALPADIVYTGERRSIGQAWTLSNALVQAYGEGVARNIGDCQAASSAVTIATQPGMLRYLAAMTRELSGRTMPVTGILDQAVHNYVVHMHPLHHAWLDQGHIAATLHTAPADAVTCTARGVMIEGTLAPVLVHWDASATVARHVRTAPNCQIDAAMRGAWPSARGERPPNAPLEASFDAVVAYYHRQRDAGWLPMFLGSLRYANEQIAIHCVGDFDEQELAILERHHCTAYRAPATDLAQAENVAHLYLSQALDRIAVAPSGQPDQVLVMDGMRAIFPRDPSLSKTIGLSVFSEGPLRIGESPYNRDRLAYFVSADVSSLELPVVSSTLMRGSLASVRAFYGRMYNEIVGRAALLGVQKVVQGAVNKLCHFADLGLPVTIHPNGAEVYFDMWPSELSVDTRHGVRIGGTVPGVVLAANRDSPLMMKLRMDLGLIEA